MTRGRRDSRTVRGRGRPRRDLARGPDLQSEEPISVRVGTAPAGRTQWAGAGPKHFNGTAPSSKHRQPVMGRRRAGRFGRTPPRPRSPQEQESRAGTGDIRSRPWGPGSSRASPAARGRRFDRRRPTGARQGVPDPFRNKNLSQRQRSPPPIHSSPFRSLFLYLILKKIKNKTHTHTATVARQRVRPYVTVLGLNDVGTGEPEFDKRMESDGSWTLMPTYGSRTD